MPLPDIDYVEIPVDWWDAEADKSLLIGVFKHGVFIPDQLPKKLIQVILTRLYIFLQTPNNPTI